MGLWMNRGLTHSNLNKLWRSAVLIKHDFRCFFCGRHIKQTDLECHHYIHRNNLLTRYDWRNGFPACKYPTEWHMSCHQYAETPSGKGRIVHHLLIYNLEHHLQERTMQSKQWFVERGITKNDFLQSMYDELKAIIKSNQ